jgi:hypothetical protein
VHDGGDAGHGGIEPLTRCEIADCDALLRRVWAPAQHSDRGAGISQAGHQQPAERTGAPGDQD